MWIKQQSLRVTSQDGSEAMVEQTVDPLHHKGKNGIVYSIAGLIVDALDNGTFEDFRKVIWTPVQ